jgi:hypothetical protein
MRHYGATWREGQLSIFVDKEWFMENIIAALLLQLIGKH